MENETVETNVETQVETTEDLSNAEETVTPEIDDNADQSAYDKAFDEMDLDDPDMSLFTESTNVEEKPEQPIPENEIVEETIVNDDPFAVDNDGYLVRPLIDRGREVRVTPEELFAFGNKGTNYENKNSEMKPYKEHLNLLKKFGDKISIEDLQSIADLSDGNKTALKHLISKYDVDVYDVDTSEESYVPETKEYNSNPVAELWSSYQQQNPKDSERVANVFNTIDENFRKEVYTEEILPLFTDDVEKGIFEQLLPETQKIKALYPKATWLQAYSEANTRANAKVTANTVPPGVSAPRDNNPSHAVDHTAKADAIWDSPEAFAEFEKRLTI